MALPFCFIHARTLLGAVASPPPPPGPGGHRDGTRVVASLPGAPTPHFAVGHVTAAKQ